MIRTLAVACASVLVAGCGADEADLPRVCAAEAPITCAVDVGERLGVVGTGSTVGRDDDFRGSRCGVGGGDGIEDIAFRWTAPAAGTYRISTEGSSFDTTLSVRMGSCAGREVACNDDAAPGTQTSMISLDMPACRTVTFVIDGSIAAAGDVRLTIHGRELVCNDGLDDDGDGGADCADEDCFGAMCPGTDPWPPASAALEWEALELINAERARGATCGGVAFPPAGPLEMNRELRQASRLHSQDMTDNDYFSHDSLDGRSLTDRVNAAGYAGGGPVGENIAAGYSTAAEAVAGWMSSDGHCMNIMNASYHLTGIGHATGRGGPRWTQDFGAR